MDVTDFLKWVLPDVPGCPMSLARQATVDAAQDFMSRSKCWREVQDPITLEEGVQEYDLEASSSQLRCMELRGIYTAAGKLIPVTLADLARVMPDWQTAEGSAPTHYTQAFDLVSIKVYPLPTNVGTDDTLTLDAVYTLKETATQIPDGVVQRWRTGIAHGAKALLMEKPGTTWTNEKLAVYHARAFRVAWEEALIQSITDNTGAAEILIPRRRFGS